MNNVPCLYAIVRFCPFVETGEFANVGVVLIAPGRRYFGFKLMDRHHARITRFFDQLDSQVYRTAIQNLREELVRIEHQLHLPEFEEHSGKAGPAAARALFMELTRPRETILRFSEIGAVLAKAPEETLGELFAYYVGRTFATKQYQEQILERDVRNQLRRANVLARFTPVRLGDDVYRANFPFVERVGETPVRAIKPLHLAHEQPSDILDHGGQWLFRINQLTKRNHLPERVLFTVKVPGPHAGTRGEAAREITQELKRQNILVAPVEDGGALLDFVAH